MSVGFLLVVLSKVNLKQATIGKAVFHFFFPSKASLAIRVNNYPLFSISYRIKVLCCHLCKEWNLLRIQKQQPTEL